MLFSEDNGPSEAEKELILALNNYYFAFICYLFLFPFLFLFFVVFLRSNDLLRCLDTWQCGSSRWGVSAPRDREIGSVALNVILFFYFCVFVFNLSLIPFCFHLGRNSRGS